MVYLLDSIVLFISTKLGKNARISTLGKIIIETQEKKSSITIYEEPSGHQQAGQYFSEWLWSTRVSRNPCGFIFLM